MKNIDVVHAFIRQERLKVGNLTSTGSKLFSYNTVIAQWKLYNGNLILLINPTKYSVTTSKHLTLLRSRIPSRTAYFTPAKPVPKDTTNLIGY